MQLGWRFIVFMALAVGLVIWGIFLLPPLTTGGSGLMPGVSQAALDQAVRSERAYCEARGTSVDCGCFAGKAGLVIAAQGPRVPGALYADQQSLARGQAAQSC